MLPPPTTEDETVLPLPVTIGLLISHPDNFIRPLITSPFARFLFRTFPNPRNHADEMKNQSTVSPPLSDPLSPSSLPPSLPQVQMHLRICLRHCTASDYALFPLSIILVIHVTPSIEFFIQMTTSK